MLIYANCKEEKGGENFVCELCDYFTSKKNNFIRHLSTDKHKNRENANKMLIYANDDDCQKKEPKKPFLDVNTSEKKEQKSENLENGNYDSQKKEPKISKLDDLSFQKKEPKIPSQSHFFSDSQNNDHKYILLDDNSNQINSHLFQTNNELLDITTTQESKISSTSCDKYNTCSCGRIFKHNSSFSRHKKTCGTEQKSSANLVVELIKDNKDLKQIIMEQHKTLNNITQNGINNTNTNTTISNSNNKTFNLQIFLNETCKDAMNIGDFVSSINVSLEDLENTGKRGYIEGISNIIVKKLNNLENHMRPLHCCDSKREILYIKDNNEWTKETYNKPILTNAIKTIANENIKQIYKWKEQYPDCTDSQSKKNDLFLKIVGNSMNGTSVEEGEKNINKIISKLAKETIIKK